MKDFDYDPFSGVKEQIHKDPMSGQITIKTEQDVQKVFDANAEKRNGNNGWKGDMHHVASIPVVVVQMWREELKKSGAPNPDPFAKENRTFLVAKLNNGEYGKLRTKEGRI